MSDQTLGIIYAIKQRGESPLKAVAEYMSEYSGSPKDEYNEEYLYVILKNAYIDYMSTCDSPSSEVARFLELLEKNYGHSMAFTLVITMGLTRVKNTDGKFVNGFREQVK